MRSLVAGNITETLPARPAEQEGGGFGSEEASFYFRHSGELDCPIVPFRYLEHVYQLANL
jgi:hypothetical protein